MFYDGCLLQTVIEWPTIQRRLPDSPVVELRKDYDGHGDNTVVDIIGFYDDCLYRTVVDLSQYYYGLLLPTTVVREGLKTTTVLMKHRH